MNVKSIFFVLVIFCVSSCSFQSSQYDYLRSIFKQDQSNQIPKKNWNMKWGDIDIDLYAINVNQHVIFADEDINIFFLDDHIYKINGLNSDYKFIEIIKNDKKLDFFINNKKVSTHYCAEKEVLSIDDMETLMTQECQKSNSNEIYQNTVRRNSNGEIIDIVFHISPEHQSLKLSINPAIRYN